MTLVADRALSWGKNNQINLDVPDDDSSVWAEKIAKISELMMQVQSLADASEHSEISAKMAEMQEEFLDFRAWLEDQEGFLAVSDRLASFSDENLALVQRLKQFQKYLAPRDELVLQDGVYVDEEGTVFCPHCWTEENRKQRVYKTNLPIKGARYMCPIHRAV